VESSDQRLCPAPFNRTGMKKRWPEMSGYSRAHDPGSNRILLWRAACDPDCSEPAVRACRCGQPDQDRRRAI